ncbi:MAG: hypothetical protein JNJ73_18485 [Hyphomonadaceae bacterium]|jgi:hypothetical protein|nr:hypothetical protein [Hyphomonadaceae bacterium]
MIALLVLLRDAALAWAFAWIGVTLEPAQRDDVCGAAACKSGASAAER